MTQELHYTSAPRGLKPGTSGFCTVAATPHMAWPLVDRLQRLSAYRRVYSPSEPQAALNPVVHMHLRLQVAGGAQHIMSRISAARLDHTDRANLYAHHVVLDDLKLPEGGPAWLLRQPGVMEHSWSGPPRLLEAGRAIPAGSRPPAACTEWADSVGDAGWAGVVAESLMARPERLIFLLFKPGMELLPLVDEALAMLPPDRRWRVNFSTYYTSGLPADVPCTLRGVLADSDEARHARRIPDALLIDLQGRLPAATGGDLVELARTGKPRAVAKLAVGSPHRPEPAPLKNVAPPPLEPGSGLHDDGGIYALDPPSLPAGRPHLGLSPIPHRSDPVSPVAGSPLLWAIAGCVGTLFFVLATGVAYWTLAGSPAVESAPDDGATGPIAQVKVGQDPHVRSEGLKASIERQIQADAASKASSANDKPAAPAGSPGENGGSSPEKHAATHPDPVTSGPRDANASAPQAPGGVKPPAQTASIERAEKPAVAEPKPPDPARTVRLLQAPLPAITSRNWTDLQAGEPLAFEPKSLDLIVDPTVSFNIESTGMTHIVQFYWGKEPLAEFRIEQRRPGFRWTIDPKSKDAGTRLRAVRDALVKVRGENGELASYLLRKRLDKPQLVLDLGKRLNDKLKFGNQQIVLAKKNHKPGLSESEILTAIEEGSDGIPKLWPLEITAVRIDRPGGEAPPQVWHASHDSTEARLKLPPANAGLPPDVFSSVGVHFVTDRQMKGGSVYVVYGEFSPSLDEAVAKINRLALLPPGSPPASVPPGGNPAPATLDLNRAQASLQAAYGGLVSFKISARIEEDVVEVLRIGSWPGE